MARVALVVHAGGRHVPSYLEAIRDIPTITDAVIVDADGSVFDQAKEVIGEKLHETYQSLDEMLQSHHPAMAIVTASGRQSPPLIRPVLDAGIHVVAEKPACFDPNDFAALTDLADKRKVHLMLALTNRLAPWVEDARRIQQQRGIGDLYAVRGMTLADQTRIWDPKRRDWSFSKSEAGGGHLIWLGIHWLDLILYLTGDTVAEVQAMTPLVGGSSIDVEDLALVNFRMASGAHGSLVSGYLLDQWYQIDMTLWGAEGWLRFGAADRDELEWHSTVPEVVIGSPPTRRLTYNNFGGGYTPFIRESLRAALGEVPPPITGAEGLAVLRVIFAAYESARTGQNITL